MASSRKYLTPMELEKEVQKAARQLHEETSMRRDSEEIEEEMNISDESENSIYEPDTSDEISESSKESSTTEKNDTEEIHNARDGNTRDESDEWTDSEDNTPPEPFSEQEEIRIDFTKPVYAFQTFSWLFDELLLEKIVEWTNKRAHTRLANPNLGRKSNMRRWRDTNIEELRKCIGLCLLIGNVEMPSIRHYWSNDPLYEHPIFGKVMSRNRFEMILRNICFYSENDDTSTRLHKVTNLVSHILRNIDKVYYPSENLSLDEALLLWKGRLAFRQYIPNKHHKYGIKFYEISTPDGFILDFLIYCGQGTVTNEQGHAFEVVKKLTAKFFNKAHTIYLDNFYCSYKLAKYLLENNTFMCGTLRKNRKGNPAKVISTKLKKGNQVWQRKGRIRVLKWHDKRDVLMISSKHNSEMVQVKSRKGTERLKPKMVTEYNMNMAGIDRADQMMAYYSTPRKSIRWYMKVFLHVLDICLWNGNWLLNKINDKKMSYLEFRDEVIKNLLGLEIQKKAKREARKTHFPQKENKRKRCRLCSQNKKRQMTWYSCFDCKDTKGTPIGLCAAPCFAEWHTSK